MRTEGHRLPDLPFSPSTNGQEPHEDTERATNERPEDFVAGVVVKSQDGGPLLLVPNDDLRKIDKMSSHTCEQCGGNFTPRSGSGGKPHRFCSNECRRAKWRASARSDGAPTANDPQRGPPPAQRPEAAAPVPSPTTKTLPRPYSAEFDWTDDDVLVLPPQPSVAAYFNNSGDLVIRQDQSPEDDAFIIIAAGNIGTFLDKLTDICGVPSLP